MTDRRQRTTKVCPYQAEVFFLYKFSWKFTEHYEQIALQNYHAVSMEMHCNSATTTYKKTNIYKDKYIVEALFTTKEKLQRNHFQKTNKTVSHPQDKNEPFKLVN